MAGIDIILTSLCLNITCDIIRLEKSPVQANYWLKNCFGNDTCEIFSLPKPTDVAFNTVESNLTSSLEEKGLQTNLSHEISENYMHCFVYRIRIRCNTPKVKWYEIENYHAGGKGFQGIFK